MMLRPTRLSVADWTFLEVSDIDDRVKTGCLSLLMPKAFNKNNVDSRQWSQERDTLSLMSLTFCLNGVYHIGLKLHK